VIITKTANTFQTRHYLLFCKFVTCGVLKRRQKYSFNTLDTGRQQCFEAWKAHLEWQIANDQNYFDRDNTYIEITDLYLCTSSMEIRNSFTLVYTGVRSHFVCSRLLTLFIIAALA